MTHAVSGELDGRAEVKRLAAIARDARICRKIDACRTIELHAFQLEQLAREVDIGFLTYLAGMLRNASVDERIKLTKLKESTIVKAV